MNDRLRSELTAAYGQLKSSGEKAEYIAWAVDGLANGAEPVQAAAAAVRPKTAINIAKELTDVAAQAARLAKMLSDLHWLSRLTLAEQAGITLVSDAQDWLPTIGQLRRLSASAKQASKNVDPTKWRLPQGRARTVAKILAHDFGRITGKSPKRVVRHDIDLGAGSSYSDLVHNVFAAMGIDANAEHFARETVVHLMEDQRGK